MKITLRPYRPEDFDAVTRLWRKSREAAFPEFQRTKGYSFEEDCHYFSETILANNHIWVAEIESGVAGFMAIREPYIDQLYIAPALQRMGIGQALLDYAKRLSPDSLRLHTFQSNRNGRSFYEKNGFRAVKFGLSPPPENEPDVEYRWP